MVIMNKKHYNLDIVITNLYLEPELKGNEGICVKIEIGDVSVDILSKQHKIEDFNEGRSFEFACTTEDIIERLKRTLLLSVFCSQDEGGDENGVLLGSASFKWPDEIYTKLIHEFSSHSTLNLIELKNRDKVVGTLMLCTMLHCKCEKRTGEPKLRIEDEIKNLIDPNDMLSMICCAESQQNPITLSKTSRYCKKPSRCMCHECYKISDCYKDVEQIKKAKCYENKLIIHSPNSRRKHKKFKSCDQIFGEDAVISEDILESCECSDSCSTKEEQTHIERSTSEQYKIKISDSPKNHNFSKNHRLRYKDKEGKTDNNTVTKWFSKVSQSLEIGNAKRMNNGDTEYERASEWNDQPYESPSAICRKVLGKKEDLYTPHLLTVLAQLRQNIDIKDQNYEKMPKPSRQKTKEMSKNGCLSRTNAVTRNFRKIAKTTQPQLRPKNKIRTKQDFIRYMRKKYKNRYTYDPTTNYPGVVLGHKHCLSAGRRVPSHMGWLWNCNTNHGRRGWRPGAVRKPIKELMSHFLKEYPLDTLPVSSKASHTKCSTLENFSTKASANEAKEQKPTISVKKRNGEFIVTMRPLKDANQLEECSDPYLNVKPIQFNICRDPAVRHKNILKTHLEELGFRKCSCGKSVSKCFCRSYMEKKRLQNEIAKTCCEMNAVGLNDSFHYSSCSTGSGSELDIEFTPPVALRNKEKLKPVDCACKETQYDENEYKIKKEVTPKGEMKSKKGKAPHEEKAKVTPTTAKRRKTPAK